MAAGGGKDKKKRKTWLEVHVIDPDGTKAQKSSLGGRTWFGTVVKVGSMKEGKRVYDSARERASTKETK